MGMHLDKALGIHPDVLRVRAERSRILASNIANDDTPGFQARDINFKDALAGVNNDFPLDSADSEMKYRVPFNPSLDGNTVELGIEQTEFAQNASEFQSSLTFLKMKYKGLMTAITG